LQELKAETVITVIEKITLKKRNLVKEITLDMAGNMGLIAKKCFPNAVSVTDRFHVQKLASEALQEIRIKYRREGINQENEDMEKAKKLNKNFEFRILWIKTYCCG
jgi:transposase